MTEFMQCPICHSLLEKRQGVSLTCEKKHKFNTIHEIPCFTPIGELSDEDAKWVKFYDDLGANFDDHAKTWDTMLAVNLTQERIQLLQKLSLPQDTLVLDVSTGTANLLFELEKAQPNIKFTRYGCDLPMALLLAAHEKLAKENLDCTLIQSTPEKLPFQDNTFDLVTHIGGINVFNDIPSTLVEWVRVLKPGGTLFFADESLSPKERKTQRGIDIIKAYDTFSLHPPTDSLPPNLKDIELIRFAKESMYAIYSKKCK